MSVWRKLNPLEWSSATIIRVFGIFFAVAMPLWFSGFSVFATSIAAPNATLEIASIGLNSQVAPVELKDRQLETPDRIVGSYTKENKVFLYGHSTGVFAHLNHVQIGDRLKYGEGETRATYVVTRMNTLPVEKVNMAQLLSSSPKKQLVLMTCAGEKLGNDDYTERLIIYATYAGE
ncbi:MAG: class F sortase [Candidatus Saccharimonadales bacterium]